MKVKLVMVNFIEKMFIKDSTLQSEDSKRVSKNTLKILRCYLRSKDYRLIDYTQFEQKYVSERKIFVKTRDYV